MSDSQTYKEVTVDADGVTVTKRFEEDEFPVPAIAFEFVSAREEAVRVQLLDHVPDSVAVEDLGFHPEYGSEYWTIEDEVITFEREIEAGSEYTTVYGIRATGTDDIEKFLTEPELTEVDPPLADDVELAVEDVDDAPSESDDSTVRDIIPEEGDDAPGLEDSGGQVDEDVETLDLKDPNDAGAEGPVADSGSTTATDDIADDEDDESVDDADDGTDSTADDAEDEADSPADDADTESEPAEPASIDGSLVATLATEIRQNEVSADDVKLLRQAFEIAGQEGGSVTARLDRLQSDVADLRAYTDALETFLDESGTGQQLIEEFESDVASLESEVEAVQEDVADNSDTLEDVTEDMDEADARIEEFEATVEELETSIEDVADQIDDGDIEDLEQEIEDLKEWQEQIKSTFAG